MVRYKENMYTQGVSTCCLIIAGGLILFGFLGPFPINLTPLIIGIIIILSQIYRISARSKLRRVVKNEFLMNPKTTVRDICNSTGMTEKDVRAIILDLKASGELMGKFSSSTGILEDAFIVDKKKQHTKKDAEKPPLYFTQPPETVPEILPNEVKQRYCPGCGTLVTRNAKYCEFCGSKLD
ncbi:MAG: hypothetical protein ACTSYC_00135 [Promethearchaeota archaeon]